MNGRACEAVGIDLGTTYSSVSYLDSQMTPRVVCDTSGQAVMPSVVYFDDDEIIVGEMALSQAKLRADRVVQFIKTHMGDDWRKEFRGTTHTPESISALILGQLVREAEPEIGQIGSAVITVPAYFSEKRRRATQQAGEIAGLTVIGTLNEPISAALAYGLHRTEREHFAVIYDLGGGTFDVTVVRVTPNELEELATSGNRKLGGRDWDQALIDFASESFAAKHGKDPRTDLQVVQDLQIECERAKRRLGRMNHTAIRMHAFDHDHTLEVTRDEFEALTAPLVLATKLTTEVALEDAGLTWRDIGRCVLIGGSTHMPAVREMLQKTSGMPPDTGVNPVVAVSLGAAIYAHMLETGSGVQAIHQIDQEVEPSDAGVDDVVSFTPPAPALEETIGPLDEIPEILPETTLPHVHFVTAHGVGVKVRPEQQWKNAVLIPRNTGVPHEVTQRFLTAGSAKAARRLSIIITQGDSADLDLVEELGIGVITLPSGEVPGKPVDVSLMFDREGRLHAKAVYVETGDAMSMNIDVDGGLKEEEVRAFRDFMEETGFGRSFDAANAIALLVDVEDDDDDDDELPLLEPI